MLVRIEEALPRLPRAERRVGKWILTHPRRAADSNLREVARAARVSEPTVVRFSRRLGLGGFRELTLRLTEALSRPGSYLHSRVAPDDSVADAATKVLDASIQSLNELRGELSALPLSAAVDTLSSARQIVFAGLGASGHVARDACHKFFRLGLPCSTYTDAPSLLQYAAIAARGDVLLLTSHTGRWPELAEAATLARQGGATVLALTRSQSPLADAADLLLPCHISEDTSVFTPMSSRLAQLALLDALQVALALALGPTAVARLRRAKAALAASDDA